MRRWRKIVETEWQPTHWTLRLECGHVAFRSAQYSRRELPANVICEACNSLVGSKVKKPLGTLGTITRYSDGLFEVAWSETDSTRWTLDELREEVEIV
jgi:hypothetical protein